MKTSAIILAAGSSSRFEDGHKLLAEIEGIPIIRRVCETLASSHVGGIFLIVPKADGPIAQAAGLGRWRIIENPNARAGLSTSLRVGLQNVPDEAGGALVALGDMPGISVNLVNALVAAFALDPARIAFPAAADGRRGHPIIWPKSLFSELEKVKGDTGGKTVLADHEALWNPVPRADRGAFADIDTRADFVAFLKSRSGNTAP